MKERIEIVSAGAGSGKTYRLADEVLEAVRSGTARPDAVLLCTFTKKAAAELEGRVRAMLLGEGLRDEAHRFRQSWIGTVHGVCLRLIREHAFEVGRSPEIAVLPEGEDAVLFRRTLSDTVTQEQLDELDRLSRSFEMDPERGPRGGGVGWEERVQKIAGAARSNRIPPEKLDACARRSVEEILRLLPPSTRGAGALDHDLRSALDQAVRALGRRVEEGSDTRQNTAGALETARRAQGLLRHRHPLTWPDWARLATLAPAKASLPAVQGLLDAAAHHAEHPRLREEIRRFIELLFAIARDSLRRYDERKREAGQVDFVDLEEICLGLLDEPKARASIRRRLDLVLVDEFQDTSPIQLALFLRLASLAPRSVWVGDQKQSIFAFRGADPDLMQAAVDAIGTAEPLERSYRSRPPLVELVNRSFAPVFPSQGIRTAVALEARRDDPLGTPALESWVLATTNAAGDARALAQGVARILDAPGEHPVVDRRTRAGGDVRDLRPGDVGILARTRASCEAVAAALARLGIPVETARPGLVSTPEALLVLSALRILLDPGDALAAGRLTFLRNASGGGVEAWLTPRLREMRAGAERGTAAWGGDPTVARIRERRPALGVLSPLEILLEAMDLSGAREMCRRWGEPGRRLANLERLAALTGEYQELARTRGGAVSTAGLLAHLARLGEAGQDEQATGGGDAVHVSTYHRAKGLEWPLVVLCDLDKKVRFTPFETAVESSAPFSFQEPLRGRWIRFWPWPYGARRKGIPLGEEAGKCELGRACEERARHEAVRLLYVGMTRARDYLVLAARPGRLARLDLLVDRAGRPTLELPQEAPPGEQGGGRGGGRGGAGAGVRVVHLALPTAEEAPGTRAGTVRWFDAPGTRAPRPAAARPCSSLEVPEGVLDSVSATLEPIGEGLSLASPGGDAGAAGAEALGNAVHAFLACDCGPLPEGKRIEIACDLLRAHEAGEALRPEDLVALAARFEGWIKARCPGGALHREWPLALRLEGASGFPLELHGTADMVAEGEGGGLEIVDHKTFTGEDETLAARARSHAGQLASYRLALERATGKRVLATWIHFPIAGRIAQVRIPEPPEAFLGRCL